MTEYGPLLQILTNRRKSQQANTQNILSQCHPDQHESHAHCPGTNPDPCDANPLLDHRQCHTSPHRTTAQLSSRHTSSSTLRHSPSCSFYVAGTTYRRIPYFAKCSRNLKKCSKYHTIRTSKIMQTQTHNKILQDSCVKCRSGCVLCRCVAGV